MKLNSAIAIQSTDLFPRERHKYLLCHRSLRNFDAKQTKHGYLKGHWRHTKHTLSPTPSIASILQRVRPVRRTAKRKMAWTTSGARTIHKPSTPTNRGFHCASRPPEIEGEWGVTSISIVAPRPHSASNNLHSVGFS